MGKPALDSKEDISLLEVIKGSTIEASLLTTFNATLPFYEDVVLRKLIVAGSKYNLVLMDRKQCAHALETPSMRPRLAGAAYGLIPMAAPGAFHPKIAVLAGKKKSTLLVGSHNLTLSGFGFNREVTNWMQLDGNADVGQRLALAHAWSLIREWVSSQAKLLPSVLLDAVYRFGEFLPEEPRSPNGDHQIRLLGQSSTGPSLLEQLRTAFPAAPRRVAILGAFFDKEHLFLQTLENLWPSANIRVVIDPETVKIGRRPINLRSQFVNARTLWEGTESQYLHAKAILMDFGDVWALASGSANPSRPAWLSGGRANFEAMILSSFSAVEASTFARHLSHAWVAPAMSGQELMKIPTTQLDGESEVVAASHPMVIAVARQEDGTIVLPVEAARGLNSAQAFGADGVLLATIDLRRTTDGELIVDLGEHLRPTRWVELEGGGRFLRVLVHHEQALQRSSQKSQRSQLRDALAGLEIAGDDLESLLGVVQRAIFDDDIAISRTAAGSPEKGHTDKDPARPDSLGVHVGGSEKGIAQPRRKNRILKDGNILEILDALIRRLGFPLAKGAADRPGRPEKSEEELIGDEEAPSEPTTEPHILREEVVKAVEDKVGRLVSRMCRRLNKAKSSAKEAQTALVQLVAVLSLVRQLRHLRHRPQWRRMRGFVREVDRQNLLSTAMVSIFGGKDGFVSQLVEDGDEPEELGQARALLAWLAWDLGYRLDGPIEPFAEDHVRLDKAQQYAVLFELLPKIAIYEDDAKLLAESVRMTKRPFAADGTRAEAWIARHIDLGEDIATAPSNTFDDRWPLGAGDLIRIPKSIPPLLRVVLNATASQIIVTELDSKRTYVRTARRPA